MENNIGFSSIFPSSGIGFAGSVGPTGATGAAQTIPGPTGATGLNSNYVTSVNITPQGIVELTLSDGSVANAGSLIGPAGTYAGVTALSVGTGFPILKGVCGGITLDFYNFRTDGLLGITYEQDGTLKFTVSPNTTAGGVDPTAIGDRIVFIETSNTINSTELIPQSSNNANRVGSTNYGYINFGGETGGRSVVADIQDTILTVGPIQRGETIVTLDTFYDIGTSGITLDVSRATVYHVVTPIGIKAFKHDAIPSGQIMSFTMIVDGDDVWNFPSDVYFDEESKAVFYPGKNIIHLWKSSTDSYWRAHFTARGFGVDSITNPGVRGSCCYFDIDETKHCEDYVTQSYCDERQGTFEGLVPCTLNSCIVQDKTYDGICCTEGRCVSDIDPSFCQLIGGYFISGITCGEYGSYPEPNEGAENLSGENPSGLCYNKCKSPSICCKNGECLGNLTQVHCEEILGGKIVPTDNCVDANCCDLVEIGGACCIQQENGIYTCQDVETPYECKQTLGGVYMGKNTNCESINCNCESTTCYKCESTGSGCGCTEKIFYDGIPCENRGEVGLYSSQSECNSICTTFTCHQCNGTDCVGSTSCVPCSEIGLEEGGCEAQTCTKKTCYSNCNEDCGDDSNCDTIEVDFDAECPEEHPNDDCNCEECPPPPPEEMIACFWCFPANIGSGGSPIGASRSAFASRSRRMNQAPFRMAGKTTTEITDRLDDFQTVIATTENITIDVPNPFLTNPVIRTIQSWPNPITYNNRTYHIPFFTISGSNSTSIGHALNNPVNIDGTFNCYYIGAYANEQNKNREKCLSRFGYDILNEQQKQECKICDAVEIINYNLDLPATTDDGIITQTQEYTVEPDPAGDIIRSLKYNCPFPPLWGRITMGWESEWCGVGFYTKQTTNLSTMSTQKIFEMCIDAHEGTLPYFMKKIHEQYVNNKKSVLQDMTTGVAFSMTNIQNIAGVTNPPFGSVPNTNTATVQANNCLKLPYVEYDPYLKGMIGGGTARPGYYGASLQYPYRKAPLGGWQINVVSSCFCSTTQPDENTQPTGEIGNQIIVGFNVGQNANGWYLPYYRQKIGRNFWELQDPLLGAYFYPAKDENFVTQIGDDYLFNLTGEIFFFKPEDEIDNEFSANHRTTLQQIPQPEDDVPPSVFYELDFVSQQNGLGGAPRGIFGRNLRYNLDVFNSSTVFWHQENGSYVKTLKESDKVAVPIVYVNWYSALGSDCYVNGGALCGLVTNCAQNECCNSCSGGGGISLCTGSGGDQNEWQISTGLISSSLMQQPVSPLLNAGVYSFNQGAVIKQKTKTVKIEEGICVNMLCPDCDLYESC
jgi:hypothetical protein